MSLLACLFLGNARQSDRRKKAHAESCAVPVPFSVCMARRVVVVGHSRSWTRQPANHRTKSWASGHEVDGISGWMWIVDVDAVDGQLRCPVYFRRRTSGRASDPPAHRASDSRHPLVPARTVQCTLKYRTDPRSPLSAPRRLERDTVLRSRKKGGRGPTAYSIQHIPNTAYCMARSKMTIEHTSNALLPGTIRPPEGTPRPMSCPESECAPANPEMACGGRLEVSMHGQAA